MAYTKRQIRDYQIFLKELKGGSMKDVLFVTGEEEYLVRWIVQTLRRQFVTPGMEKMDYAVFSEPDADADSILGSLETFSMFSKKRVVWVRDVAPLRKAGASRGWTLDGIRRLAAYAEKPNEKTVCVFSTVEADGKSDLVKALKKSASCYEVPKLDRRQLANFAGKRLKTAGKEISTRDMNQLLDLSGYLNKENDYHLFEFEGDLAKIIAHASGTRVTAEDIDAAVSGEGERFVFSLLDGISGNDKTAAFEIIHNSLANGNEDEMRLVTSIASQMELLLEVREFLDSGDGRMSFAEMHAYTGINEYRLKKAAGYARKYSAAKLRRMVLGIYETNARIVTGLMTPRLALEMFIAAI